jgi:hypothetical protein
MTETRWLYSIPALFIIGCIAEILIDRWLS